MSENKKFTQKVYEEFKEEKKEKAIENNNLSESEKKVIEKIFKEAKMPVELKDEDIVCGEGELDIRKLSDENKWQMLYRAQMLNIVYQRRIADGLTDLIRFMAVICRRLGVDRINEAIDEAMAQMAKELQGKVN